MKRNIAHGEIPRGILEIKLPSAGWKASIVSDLLIKYFTHAYEKQDVQYMKRSFKRVFSHKDVLPTSSYHIGPLN